MKRSTIWDKKSIRIGISALFWLAVWQTVSFCTPKMLFASPMRTLSTLLRIGITSEFWLSILHTLGLVTLGFALGFVFGCVFAVLSFNSGLAHTLLRPAVQVMNSVPVACFVVVALIWMSSAYIAVLVSFFVVFPVTFVSTLAGLNSFDPALTEMVCVFRVPLGKRVRSVYLPQILPEVLAGCRMSVGMCWKAGIAGEIIGLPAHTIGERLYLAKLYLSIDELFAWTIVIILISLLFEKLFVQFLRVVQQRLEVSHGYSVT